MNKFKLFLALLVVAASTAFAVAKFLVTEAHDFWLFLQGLHW